LPTNVVITAPNSSFFGNQKCLVLNYGLFVVLTGSASFTIMEDMTIVIAWFIYRQLPRTDAVHPVDCQHAVAVSCLAL
jgi:hypothetical protein